MKDELFCENEYFNDEDKKRLARMLMLSRAESGISQEKVALELGIAKKTVQNWERGVSAPTLIQAIEWFRVMKVAALPYLLQFIYPDIEGIGAHDTNEKIRKELINLINDMPSDGVRQLMYLFYGNHGSSPRGVMNVVTAHLQSPLKDRYSHTNLILNDYKIAKERGKLSGSNHIQPDIELIEKVMEKSLEAIICGKENYFVDKNMQ